MGPAAGFDEHRDLIGEMADTVGVSKSAVSRETVEASEAIASLGDRPGRS